jgi:hypothetical protein
VIVLVVEMLNGCGGGAGVGLAFGSFVLATLSVLMLFNSQVHSVLEKLQPDMIALDAQFVGKVDRAPSEVIAGHCTVEFQKLTRDKVAAEERAIARAANDARRPKKQQQHMRGRSSISKVTVAALRAMLW